MKTTIPYIFIVVSFLFTLCGCQNIQTQEQPTAEIEPSIITPENIDQLEYIERWGRGGINQVALSDNEQYSASASRVDIVLYDIAEEERILVVEFDEETHRSDINPLAFSYDNNLFAYGEKDITIWNIRTKETETEIHLSERLNYPCYLVFDSSNRYLAIVGNGEVGNDRMLEANLSVYDLETEEIILEMPIQYRNKYNMPVPIYPAFISDQRIAYFNTNNELIFWDISSQEVVFSQALEQYLLSVSSDGLKYSSLDEENGLTSFIDIQTGEEEHAIDGYGYYLPDQDDIWLVITTYDYPWDWKILDTNEQEHCEIDSHLRAISKDVFLQGTKVYRILENEFIETWNAITCEETRRVVAPIHRDGLAISEDGQYLLSSNWDFANIINSVDGKEGTAIPCISQDFTNAAFQFTSDSQHLAMAYPENRSHFYMFNFVDWNIEQDIELPYYEDTYRVAVSSDMKVAAISAHLGTTFWDLEKEEPYGERLSDIRAIWFSPNNTTIATVENDKLLFRDIETLEIMEEMDLPYEYVSLALLSRGTYDIVFNHDWTEIYIFSTNRVERWDMNGSQIRILENPTIGTENGKKTFFTCSYPVLTVDDQILAAHVAGRSGTELVFWDTRDGKVLRELESSFVNTGLAFDPVSARFFAENGAYIDVWGVKED